MPVKIKNQELALNMLSEVSNSAAWLQRNLMDPERSNYAGYCAILDRGGIGGKPWLRIGWLLLLFSF